jgi:hypothetical protein
MTFPRTGLLLTELVGNASISTTARATLMLPTLPENNS